MALIKCPECGKEFSDTATTCPHCGYSPKQLNMERNLEKVLKKAEGFKYCSKSKKEINLYQTYPHSVRCNDRNDYWR